MTATSASATFHAQQKRQSWRIRAWYAHGDDPAVAILDFRRIGLIVILAGRWRLSVSYPV